MMYYTIPNQSPAPNTIYTKPGFTLIEISIVLVIIGLVVGGILTGRDLIYAAQLRKMGAELQKLEIGVTTFRLKYNCLPGDCTNGETFSAQIPGAAPLGQGRAAHAMAMATAS